MADEAKVGPVDSGLLQADIAVESAEKARKAEKAKKGKDPVLHLKKPDPEPAKKPEPVAPAAQAEEVDDDGDSAGDEDGQQSTTNPGKANTPRGVQKKLDKLTREKYEERALREEAERRLALLEQRANGKAETPAKKPESAEGKPTLAQFNYDQEQYLEALSDWRFDRKMAEIEERKAASEKEKTEREKAAGYQQRLDEFAAEHPDYHQVAVRNPINYTPTMVEFVRDSELGPQVAYYLGRHLDEGHAISAMSTANQVRKLDELAVKLSEPEPDEPSVPQRRTITQAPPPPATIASSGHARRSINDPSLSSAERIAMWRRKKTG